MSDYEDTTDDDKSLPEQAVLESPTHERVIIFLDVDCFAYQLWVMQKYPHLKGQDDPAIVVNPDQVILAVNYAAKDLGITRKTGRKKAERACLEQTNKDLIVLTAGKKYGLVDTETPIMESDKILRVLRNYRKGMSNKDQFIIERSSLDEFYVDVSKVTSYRTNKYGLPSKNEIEKLTEIVKHKNRHDKEVIMEGGRERIYGRELRHRIERIYADDMEYYNHEIRLVHGAVIAQELLEDILYETGYRVSFAIAENKLTAKISCGLNKPEGITIIPRVSTRLLMKLKLNNLPGFGGIIGDQLSRSYGIETLEDVLETGGQSLGRKFSCMGVNNPFSLGIDLEKKANLWDNEMVQKRYFDRTLTQSISFKGQYSLRDWEWDRLKVDIGRLSNCFLSKLHYQLRTHRRFAELISVKVILKSGRSGNGDGNIFQNHHHFRTAEAITQFVLEYMHVKQVRLNDLHRVFLRATRIQKVENPNEYYSF